MNGDQRGPLGGRRVLVTGVSRRAGIGYAVVRSLTAQGATVVAHSWAPHDAAQPWGPDPAPPAALLSALPGPPHHLAVDLGTPEGPAALVDQSRALAGGLDTLVVNHAHSARGSLGELTADVLDRAWAVNARGALLLVQAFAAQFTGDDGRIVVFTSGQYREPMPDELPYAVSKAAIQQATKSLAAPLAERGITVNCIDPGPTDTGWADDATVARVVESHPRHRWSTPGDAAALVSWLVGPGGAWLTGQTIANDGGWGARA